MSFYNSNSFTLPSLSILFCRLWLLALTTTTLNMLESGLASTSSLKQNNKYSFHILKKQNTFWNPQILCEIIWIFPPYLSWFYTASQKKHLVNCIISIFENLLHWQLISWDKKNILILPIPIGWYILVRIPNLLEIHICISKNSRNAFNMIQTQIPIYWVQPWES